MQAAPRPRRFKETTNSKWDDYYEAESPPAYPPLQRISSARQGSFSDKALLLLSGDFLFHMTCIILLSCCSYKLSDFVGEFRQESAVVGCVAKLMCVSHSIVY